MLVEADIPVAPIGGSAPMEQDGVACNGMGVEIRGEAEWWSWWAAKWTTPQNMMVPDCLGR